MAIDDPTRQALLAAAHDLLATDGAAALTVRAIADKAGVSTMNVYSRFGGKDGVVEELFKEGFRRLAAAMAVPESDDPLIDMAACGRAYIAFARANPTYYSLMFGGAVPGFHPTPETRVEAVAVLDEPERRVQRAIDAGLLHGDAFTIAAGLWASVHGLASLSILDMTDTEGVSAFDWDAITGPTLDALTCGLRGDPAERSAAG